MLNDFKSLIIIGIQISWALSWILCSPLGAQAERAKDKSEDSKSEREFQSFATYVPKPEEYPQQLRPIVEAIVEASAQKAAHQKDAAQQTFTRAVSLADSLLTKVNRAFVDKVYFLMGYAHEAGGDTARALTAYEKAIEHRPGNSLATFRRAAVLHKTGRCSKAVPLYREVLWDAPRLSHELHYFIGECLAALGQTEAAAKEFELTYQKNPTYLPGLKQLAAAQGTLYREAIDPRQKAELQNALIQTLNAVLKQAPNDRDAALALGEVLLAGADPLFGAQRIARTEELAETFVKASEYKDEAMVRLLFRAKLKRGNLSAAEKIVNAGLAAIPQSKVYADCQKQLGIEKQLRQDVANNKEREE